MKIFLPFSLNGIGGVRTFANKFRSGMEARGHTVYFEEPRDYDVLFLIVQAPFKYLLHARKQGKPIVQRLDGVWYWSVAGWKFPLYNLKAALIRHCFTDFTIYQSQYSRYSAEKFLGKKSLDSSALVYNGVDLNLFTPDGEKHNFKENPEQTIFFTATAFRREDQILPLLRGLERYRAKYGENFQCLVAGTFSAKVSHIPQEWAHFKQVKFLGKIENAELPLYERASDVFLFTHLNPPCPNNVIEAMACGLPICGINDGAMSELVESGKNGLLLETHGDAFWKARDLNIEQFTENMHQLASHKAFYGLESRKRALVHFSLENMLDKYQKALDSLHSL